MRFACRCRRVAVITRRDWPQPVAETAARRCRCLASVCRQRIYQCSSPGCRAHARRGRRAARRQRLPRSSRSSAELVGSSVSAESAGWVSCCPFSGIGLISAPAAVGGFHVRCCWGLADSRGALSWALYTVSQAIHACRRRPEAGRAHHDRWRGLLPFCFPGALVLSTPWGSAPPRHGSRWPTAAFGALVISYLFWYRGVRVSGRRGPDVLQSSAR